MSSDLIHWADPPAPAAPATTNDLVEALNGLINGESAIYVPDEKTRERMQAKNDSFIEVLQGEINLLLGFANSSSAQCSYQKVTEDGIWGPQTQLGLMSAANIANNNPSKRPPFDEAYARAWLHIPESDRLKLSPPRKSLWDLEAERDESIQREELTVHTELRLIRGAFVATATVTALGTVFRSQEWTRDEASLALRLAIEQAVAGYTQAAPVPVIDALGEGLSADGTVPDEAFEL